MEFPDKNLKTFFRFLKYYIFESRKNSNKNCTEYLEEKLVCFKGLNDVYEKSEDELVEIIFRVFD